MKITHVKITPIAFRDPPLLNAAGIHEPYALRSIIEIESDNGYFGLGESYGDAPVLEMLTNTAALLPGMSVFDTNGLRQRVAATVAKGTREARIHSELAPGTDPLRDVEKIYSALEVAFLDLQARYLGVPLVELLGGAVRREVPYSAYLFYKYAQHIGNPYPPDRWGEVLTEEQLVREAQMMVDEYGFGSLKLKAGALPPQQEVAGLKALQARVSRPAAAHRSQCSLVAADVDRDGQAARRRARILRRPDAHAGRHGRAAPGDRPAAGDQHGGDDAGAVRAERAAERGADHPVGPSLLGRLARHADARAHVRDLRAGPVDALQLAPGH